MSRVNGGSRFWFYKNKENYSLNNEVLEPSHFAVCGKQYCFLLVFFYIIWWCR